jgi:hypothetical protein
MANRGFDFIGHQHAQAKTNSGARDDQQRINRKLFGSF